MNDFLKYVSLDPIYRKHNMNLLTFSFMYAWSENFILVLSHDSSARKASMLNKCRGLLAEICRIKMCIWLLLCSSRKETSVYGGEFGQFIEWKYKESLTGIY